MAANLQRRGFAKVGKRIVDRNWTPSSRDPVTSSPVSIGRRGAHFSVYDKNPDDEVRPSVVPDDVIQSAQSDKYWAPHPKTGVFGPADHNGRAGGENQTKPTPSGSVLEQTAWFRPLEDVDKPQHASNGAFDN
ncbi:late embryogenesis abundant protein At5g17165-like [Tasmannia lanceolata]|uniref:late embryogenesis abundant protein At5g17165-like n=1 Tax=Tasmannia lanceolata TaxID=3420 RepID=UPI004063C715